MENWEYSIICFKKIWDFQSQMMGNNSNYLRLDIKKIFEVVKSVTCIVPVDSYARPTGFDAMAHLQRN